MKNLSPLAALAAVVHLFTLTGLVYVATQERRTRMQADALRRALDDVTVKVTAVRARLDIHTAEWVGASDRQRQAQLRHLASVTALPCPKVAIRDTLGGES